MALHGLGDDDVVISGIAMAVPGAMDFLTLADRLSNGFPVDNPNKGSVLKGKAPKNTI